MRVQGVTWTGNGTSQTIATNWQPALIIGKASASTRGFIVSSSMVAGTTKPLTGTLNQLTDAVTGITAAGFSVGTSAYVNTNGTTYYALVFAAEQGQSDFEVGTYTGTGVSQAIPLTFVPDMVFAWSCTPDYDGVHWRTSSMSAGDGTLYQVNTSSDGIAALSASSFTVGTNEEVNYSGRAYYYAAFKNDTDAFKVVQHTGNGADDRNITGIGFNPTGAMLKHQSAATVACMRFPDNAGDNSAALDNSAGFAANGIQSFPADGYQVGTDAMVNTNLIVYNGFVVKGYDGAGGATTWAADGDYGVGVFQDFYAADPDKYGIKDDPATYKHIKFGVIDMKWDSQQDGNWGKVGDATVDQNDGFEYWIRKISGKTDGTLGQTRDDGYKPKMFLKVQLRGNDSDVSGNGSHIPAWVYAAPYSVTKLTLKHNGQIYTYPYYWEAGFLSALDAMLVDFATDYASDNRVEGIFASLGEDGEAKPFNTSKANWIDEISGKTWQQAFIDAGMTVANWEDYVANACAKFILRFPAKPVFYVCGWLTFGGSIQMRRQTEKALNKGCHLAATYWEDELDPPFLKNGGYIGWYGPVSWLHDYCRNSVGLAANRRLYVEMGGSDPREVTTTQTSLMVAKPAYWQMWYALSCGADYFGAYRDQSRASTLTNKWPYFNKYAGKELATTPGAFIAFRKESPNLWQPQKYMQIKWTSSGDQSLKVNDVDAGDYPTTKVALDYYIYADYQRWLTLYSPETTTVGLWNVGPSDAVEGVFARSTDLYNSNHSFWLLVDDLYIAPSGSAVHNTTSAGKDCTLYVTYLDAGTANFEVYYDKFGVGSQIASPASVTRTGTGTWKTATFTLTAAKFSGALTNSADIQIKAITSDLTLHLVELVASTGGTPPAADPVEIPSGGTPTGRTLYRYVYDDVEGQPLAGVKADVYRNDTGKKVDTVISDRNGLLTLTGLLESVTYRVVVRKRGGYQIFDERNTV